VTVGENDRSRRSAEAAIERIQESGELLATMKAPSWLMAMDIDQSPERMRIREGDEKGWPGRLEIPGTVGKQVGKYWADADKRCAGIWLDLVFHPNVATYVEARGGVLANGF